MRLKRADIKNFRAIRDAQVDLEKQSALLGANGTGKSTVLRAIDRFYGPSTSIELDDFFGRKTTEPIEIALTFTGFTEAEQELFESRIHGDNMTVVRVFDASGGKTNGRYYGFTPQYSSFTEIRQASSATAKREAYASLRSQRNWADELPAVKRAEEIEPALATWELNHPDQCTLLRDDGQFFGFTNVFRGNLQKATVFVLIPAVRDASADAIDARGAVIARVMELVVRSAVQRRAEIRAFQARVSEDYRRLTDPTNLHELGDLASDLTHTLRIFYEDAAVKLRWKASEDLTMPLPTADVLLNEAGFEGPVDRKGHGLQRAFIFTLLQHLAKAVSVDTARAEREGAAEATPGEGAAVVEAEREAQAPVPLLPGLILAIEEPELYQHPTKQRHFARVLSQLSDGSLPGVATQTQVIYTCHSSLFVAMDRFDEVRLARRHSLEDGEHKECRFAPATLADVAHRLEVAWTRTSGTFTAASLRSRLHIISSEIAEGLFAEMAVVVEGPSDKAAIHAAAQLNNIDLEALGIAVLPAGGKGNVDKPAAIFLSLGIPTFVIWDCDRSGGTIENVETNRALQRLMGRPEADIVDAATLVDANFACFDMDLEKTLKAEIGADIFGRHLDAVKDQYGVESRSDAQKAPSVMAEVLVRAAAEGGRSATLDRIVSAVHALRQGTSRPRITAPS